MSDLTIIFLTANKLPQKWVEFQKAKLLEAAGSKPIITISREPLDWGMNILQTEPYGNSNIYFQMLKGAKKTQTDFIGIAEDDVLYPKEHFDFRPPEDAFAYNMNRFNLFTWGKPTFSWKYRMGNFTLIAPRKLMLEALEERFQKYPDGLPRGYAGELGRDIVADKLRVKRHKAIWFNTKTSVIHIDHEFGTDPLAKSHRKSMGILQAYDIPYWGKAEDIINNFK